MAVSGGRTSYDTANTLKLHKKIVTDFRPSVCYAQIEGYFNDPYSRIAKKPEKPDFLGKNGGE
jgi:hypothetical protein